MKIACISLGCPKNQVDLDVMVHILLSAGHETVADLAEADVILVNTCGFIESAKTEAIENILEACAYKQQNPDLKVIVTGCLAERYRSQIEEEIPEVDAVVGCASNKAIDTIGASRGMALNISYSAWAIIFALVLQGTIPTLTQVLCCVVILVGTVLAATSNWGDLLPKRTEKVTSSQA